MSRQGRIEAAGCRTRQALLVFLAAVAATAVVHASEADLLPSEKPDRAPELDKKGQRMADAMAHFAVGLFEEESDGPEKAMPEYGRALELDPGNTELAIRVAYDDLRRGDTAEAISVLKDAAKAAPKETAPLLTLSTIYLRHLHKPELAMKYAQMALEAAPATFGPYEAMWEIYQNQGLATKAEQVLDKAAKSKSQDGDFWISLAQLASRNLIRDGGTGTLTPAEMGRLGKILDKAKATADDDPAVLSKVGDIHVLARQIDLALPCYKRVVELRASYPNAREKLAGCYIEVGQSKEATAVLEDVVKADPLEIAAYEQLTELYLKAGELSKALADARQCLLIQPQELKWHLQVIDLLYRMRDYAKMADALSEARKRFPNTGKLAFFHGIALTQIKHHDEAMRAFEEAEIEAMNSQPDMLDADFYFQYGAAAEQAGRYVKAAELFQKSIDLDPSNAESLNYLGFMWADHNENLDKAEKLIRRALEIEPGNAAYVDSLGWLLYRQGKYKEALSELLHAAEGLPDPDPVVFEHIADTYDKLGKKTGAVLYWQKAQQLDPDNKMLAEKLDAAAEKVVQQPAATPTPAPAPVQQ